MRTLTALFVLGLFFGATGVTNAQVYELTQDLTAFKHAADMCTVEKHLTEKEWKKMERFLEVLKKRDETVTVTKGAQIMVVDEKPDCGGLQFKIPGKDQTLWAIKQMMKVKSEDGKTPD